MKISTIWKPARVNPENGKALTIPVLNPYDIYGRVFMLSWLSFMVAFLSWFAFPPLMSDIKKDLNLTAAQVNNSNIVGLCSTLLARFILGPLCDRFGPRYVMAGILFAGAVPTAFVPLVKNISGIYAIRFFIGFLGGTFVPCQFWTATFFDKSVVGTASALAAGWGNAGGGIAFFVMPAVTRGLQHQGYSLSHSWKYAFDVCPLVIIFVVGICVLLLGQDAPEGAWRDRARFVEILDAKDEEVQDFIKRKPGYDIQASSRDDAEKRMYHTQLSSVRSSVFGAQSSQKGGDREEYVSATSPAYSTHDINLASTTTHGAMMMPMKTAVSRLSKIGAHDLDPITDPHSTIEDPTLLDVIRVSFSLPTMLNALPYATTFGGELAVESIVATLYAAHSKKVGHPWSTSLSGDWGSMLGLLNVVFRPMGGFISDVLYARFGTPLAKKYWMLSCGFLMGVFLLYIGLYRTISMPGLVVSLAFMSLFMEMGNGANFSLVPHTNPHHTGIVAGTTGAFGNMGGVLFSLAYRFSTEPDGETDYMAATWRLGIAIMSMNAICVLFPLAKDDRY